MKRKFVYAAVFAATLMMGFVSCKDDDEDPEPEPTPVVEKQFTVKFDANGGTGSAADATVKEGQEATLPATGITREGYTFKGWSESKDGAVVTSFKPTADATLYAVWEKNAEPAPSNADKCIIVSSSDLKEFNYDTQFWIVVPDGYKAESEFELTMKVKADYAAKSVGPQIHNDPGNYVGSLINETVNFDTEWKEVTLKGKIEKDGKSIAFNLNDDALANKYYFDDISLKIDGTEVIANGDLSGDEFKNFVKKENQGDILQITAESVIDKATIKAAEPRQPKKEDVDQDGNVIDKDESNFTKVAWDGTGDPSKISFDNGVIVVKNPEVTTNFWDVQYNVIGGFNTKAGVNTKVTITVKGSVKGSLHYRVGNWSVDGKMGTAEFGTDWSDIVIEGTDFADVEGAFLMLQHGDVAGDVYIKAVKVSHKAE